MSTELEEKFECDPSRFKREGPEKLAAIFHDNPAWYMDPLLQPLIREYFIDKRDEGDKDEKWRQEKQDFICLVADLLAKGAVSLGTKRGEGYNDDDKATFKDGQVEWVKKPSIVVIHHTNTPQDTPYQVLNAWHLMRLYCPLYISKYPHFYGGDENPRPIESGHFFEGEGLPRHQTFIGYAHLVWNNGRSVQTLRDEYMGLQCGDLNTNRKSFGIAIVDELKHKLPSRDVIKEVASIIRKKIQLGILPQDFVLLGHKDVQKPDGTFVDTACPGEFWGQWRDEILRLVHR